MERALKRFMTFPFRLLPSEAEIKIPLGPLKGSKWVVGSGPHSLWLGRYESHVVAQFDRITPSGSVVYDVGAAVGLYTILASRRIGPNGEVLAFEPSPRNLSYLHRHVRLNALKNVTIIEAAVADADGEGAFLRHSRPFQGRMDAAGDLRVRVVSLDGVVRQDQRRAPDILKIDVEGAELRVLHGATEILAKHQPIIFLATHGAHLYAECCSILEENCYTWEVLAKRGEGGGNDLLAVPKRYRGHELSR
jgi:FkbM family methyltransferase